MIVDTETHVIFRLWPLEANPNRSMTERYTWHEHGGDLLAAEMDRSGVDKTWMISYDAEDMLPYFRKYGFGPQDYQTGRGYTLEACRRHPEKFVWFNTLKDPRREDALDLVRQDFEDGSNGLKIFPPLMNLAIDDPAMMAVYRLCVEEDRAVMYGLESTRPPDTHTHQEYFEQLERVATEFPDLRIQVNHVGGPDPLEDLASQRLLGELAMRSPNVLLSTAYLGMVWDDQTEYPYPTYLRRLELLSERFGVENFAWGTDWPWFEHFMLYPQAVDSIRRHASFWNEQEKAMFLGENAMRWIGEPRVVKPRDPDEPVVSYDSLATSRL